MDTQILIVGLYTIAIVIALVIFLPKKTNNDTVQPPTNSFETLMLILQETIQREVKHHHVMVYKVRDVKVIYDFKEDLTTIVKGIMNSYSSTFLKELEFYYSRDYIIRYVTRIVEEYLIEYTNQNKIKTK